MKINTGHIHVDEHLPRKRISNYVGNGYSLKHRIQPRWMKHRAITMLAGLTVAREVSCLCVPLISLRWLVSWHNSYEHLSALCTWHT